MGIVIEVKTESGLPTIEAMIQSSVPESVLMPDKLYLTGLKFAKTLTFKGETYSPGPLQILKIEGNSLNYSPAPANYTFQVGGKTFKLSADRTQITIIAGGEPILWRVIKALLGYNPTNTSNVFLPTEQGMVTTGQAETPFTYFYTLNGIYQTEPLQDGTMFRLIEPGSGAITWRRFAKSADGGVFEETLPPANALITSIKNIDLTKLGDINAIVDALDTVDSKRYDAIIFGRDNKNRIEASLLLNAQKDPKENGLYYFECIEGDNAGSIAQRISPYLKNQIAWIGRAKCIVWRGDRFGQDEVWINSNTPIGPTQFMQRVSIGNTPHFWAKSKPDIAIERQIATLESQTVTEEDKAAIVALNDATTKLEDAIALKAASADVTIALEDLSKDIDTLDTAKASAADLKKAQDAIDNLTKLLADNTATDTDLKASIKTAQDAVDELKKSLADNATADGQLKTSLKTTQDTVDKLTRIESAREPTIADLDKPWDEWWHYSYDFPTLKATVSVWKRSPLSNDLFPPLSPLGVVDISLTPIDRGGGQWRLALPQGATFNYEVNRQGASNSLEFPAGTFSVVSSYYLDSTKTVLNVGVRAQTVTPTQTAIGLGIIVAAPANAAFVRYEFQFVLGGKLIYDYAI